MAHSGTGRMDSNDIRPEQKLDGSNDTMEVAFAKGRPERLEDGGVDSSAVLTRNGARRGRLRCGPQPRHR